jgi:DNA repair protein RadC
MIQRRRIYTTDQAAVMEAAAYYLRREIERGAVMDTPQAVTDYLRAELMNEKHEVFAVIFLDTRHRVIEFERLFTGTIDGATVYPRVIAERALHHQAGAVILAHNHPSGVAEPSLADQAITRRIKEALALLDVRTLDHFVIGDGVPVSMAERGLI